MADVGRAENGLGDASNRDHPAASRELSRKRDACGDLAAPGRPVRALGARMRRDDVPEQDALLEAELGQDAVDDRRARFRRADAGQLPFGGEGDPGNPSAAVAGRLADEQERRVATGLEVGAQPLSPRDRALAVTIEVERGADLGAREPLNERRLDGAHQGAEAAALPAPVAGMSPSIRIRTLT